MHFIAVVLATIFVIYLYRSWRRSVPCLIPSISLSISLCEDDRGEMPKVIVKSVGGKIDFPTSRQEMERYTAYTEKINDYEVVVRFEKTS